jgi:L-ribulose-5-phosphate 4-epimerase
MKDGYIKFTCNWMKKPININNLSELNKWRNKLYKLELIGAYDNGIGFGNMSTRLKNNSFIITGSATGNLKRLTKKHYSLVKDFNIKNNFLTCSGETKASSESLSHAIIYENYLKVNAVIHIHNLKLWNKLKNKFPTTDKKAKYGTPEMAFEIKKLLKKNKNQVIIMGGHKEGILAFGKNIEEAGNIILNLVEFLNIENDKNKNITSNKK